MNRYKFASQKMGKSLLVDEKHEFDFCFILEYSDEVLSYEAQPKAFYYDFHGRRYRYTTDFLVHYGNGTQQLIEVKPYSLKNNPEFRDKFDLRKQAALDIGEELILVTDKQIQKGFRLNNYKLLHRHSPVEQLKKIHFIILDYLSNQTSSILQLNESIGFYLEDLIEAVSLLLFKGKLETNLITCEFNEHSVLGLKCG